MTEERESGDTLMLVLCYFGPLALIPYLTREDEAFIRWHAKQGLTLTAAWIGLYIVLGLLTAIPGLGLIFRVLPPFVGLAVVALAIVGIIKALAGERWPIPIISEWAEKW